MSVSRKTGDVFDVILNAPSQMIPDAQKNNDGSWSFSTPRGSANLTFKENRTFGILDHLYVDNEAKWEIPMRVIPSGDESEVIVTIVKPESLTDDQFDERMAEIESLFSNLKKLIEQT